MQNSNLAFFVGCTLLVVVHAQVRVVSPETLAVKFASTRGVIYGTTATFGAPFYGERVLGRVLYGASQHGKDHCSDNDYTLPTSFKTAKDLVKIVVVRRGQCTFVTKVKVAQEKGAHAVIVVDKASSPMHAEEIQRIVMSDDGWGDSVTIPSLLISRFEGELLINSLQDGHDVIAEMVWDIPRAEVVLADFWMDSADDESSEFLERFKACAETLKYHLQFMPHYWIFSLPPGKDYGLCADGNAAQHCAPDPDGSGPITGADVANEDARQLCIWHSTVRTDPNRPINVGAKYSQEFWEYAVAFFHQCPVKADDPSQRFGETCSYRIMDQVGIDRQQVEACLAANKGAFLDEQVRNKAWSPIALRLNGWRYSGPLDPQSVLKAICSGYTEPPDECTDLLFGYTGFLRYVKVGASILWMVLIVVVLVVIFVYFYKRHLTKSMSRVLREEVMLEVQTQMTDYAPLQDSAPGNRNRTPLSF